MVNWPPSEHGNAQLYVLRKEAPDVAWRRAAALPRHLQSRYVGAAYSFEGTADDWMREIDGT